jgi:1-deoxy-D-xylulose-5-phosphate reductoisomerase
MKKRRVVVLGATGSIGESAAKVARDIPERMEIVGMSAHKNVEKLAALSAQFPHAKLCVTDEQSFSDFSKSPRLGASAVQFSGEEGLVELATLPEADMVLIAIVGTGGLRPALTAIEAGKDIAVASKEILVMAGEIVIDAARKKGVRVLPVDSEHNAIFQCLEGRLRATDLNHGGHGEHGENVENSDSKNPRAPRGSSSSDIRRLILTASGGPFRKTSRAELDDVTPEQALKHPTWNMGAKITIDSATLFNKGLEMIEARWLFDVEMPRVDVVVHPQSIIHSMVEFVDGSVLAQLSHSDMCFPIQYAVTWPDRVPNSLRPLDFAQLGRLEFEAPRYEDFPALNLARRAGETGGTLPAVMNAANEVAVEAFLKRKIRFPDIWQTVAQVMDEMDSQGPVARAGLDAILRADSEARARAAALVAQ